MYPFQLQQDRPDKSGSWRYLDSRCLLGCLTVTRTVYISSYPSYPLGEKRDLVIGQGAITELFDTAVIIKAAVVATDYFLAFHEDPEVSRLFQNRVKGTYGEDAGGRRWCL